MNMTPAIYGAEPVDLGRFDIDASEMKYWLYLPIKMPGSYVMTLNHHVSEAEDILFAARNDCVRSFGMQRWKDAYVYLSLKTLIVTPDAPGNRPGWHSDGFLTDDLNYIWSDRNPTEFFIADPKCAKLSVSADHAESIEEFEMWAANVGTTFWNDRLEHAKINHLYRLDQTHVHRVSKNVETGKRAFIKVSVSDKPYVQLGNSINHNLPEHPRPSLERIAERNCPTGAM